MASVLFVFSKKNRHFITKNTRFSHGDLFFNVNANLFSKRGKNLTWSQLGFRTVGASMHFKFFLLLGCFFPLPFWLNEKGGTFYNTAHPLVCFFFFIMLKRCACRPLSLSPFFCNFVMCASKHNV